MAGTIYPLPFSDTEQCELDDPPLPGKQVLTSVAPKLLLHIRAISSLSPWVRRSSVLLEGAVTGAVTGPVSGARKESKLTRGRSGGFVFCS